MGTTGPRSQTRALSAHARAVAVVHVDIQMLGGFVGSVSACQFRVRTLADVRCHALARGSPESTAPARPRRRQERAKDPFGSRGPSLLQSVGGTAA